MAGRIFDRLARHYGSDCVFIDIDSIPMGVDFDDHLERVLADCDILLALIGPNWIGRRKGQPPRIKDEDDWVRLEVEKALGVGVPIIPVLLEGASLPKREQLPESLHGLLRKHGCELDSGRDFHTHVNRLIEGIDLALDRSREMDSPTQRTTSAEPPEAQGSEPRQHAEEPSATPWGQPKVKADAQASPPDHAGPELRESSLAGENPTSGPAEPPAEANSKLIHVAHHDEVPGEVEVPPQKSGGFTWHIVSAVLIPVLTVMVVDAIFEGLYLGGGVQFALFALIIVLPQVPSMASLLKKCEAYSQIAAASGIIVVLLYLVSPYVYMGTNFPLYSFSISHLALIGIAATNRRGKFWQVLSGSLAAAPGLLGLLMVLNL